MSTSETQPNLFELSGDQTRVTYSTTSFTGQPQLTYWDQTRGKSFSGEEINTQALASELGTLVTVTLDTVPDLQIVTFSLLLPLFNLEDGGSTFQTQAIETTHRTSIGGPGLVRGALQIYRSRSLEGTARLVDF